MARTDIGNPATTTRFITNSQLSYIHARCHCVYYCCGMSHMGCSDVIQTVKNLLYGPVQRLRSPVYLLPYRHTIQSRCTLSSYNQFLISTSEGINCTTPPRQVGRAGKESCNTQRLLYLPLHLHLMANLWGKKYFIRHVLCKIEWERHYSMSPLLILYCPPYEIKLPVQYPSYKLRSFIATIWQITTCANLRFLSGYSRDFL